MRAARMSAWRAHAYGALGELRLEPARVPALRAPDELLVRVTASALNPLDVAMLGGYGARALNVLRALEGGGGVEFPLVPGRELLGRVARAGPAARLAPGARVWAVLPPHAAGAHAHYVAVKDRWAGEAPATLGVGAGGALYAGLSAAAALRAAGLPGAGAKVLLLGLGGVGQAALQLLAHARAEVTVGCSAALGALAERLGAARVLDRRATDYETQLSRDGPYWAVLDCAGLGGEGARGLHFARYVTLSSPLLRSLDARGAAAGALCAGALLLQHSAGAASASRAPPAALLPPHVRWAFFSPRADDIELLRRLAERRQFEVTVERVYPWRAAAAAYARAAQGGARGKLLLDFTDDSPP